MNHRDDHRILFIHPRTPMFLRCILPLSLPALIKRIREPVAGFYADEAPLEALRRARIIIADVHWHLGLKGAAELVRRVRLVNPHAALIAGGITASLFPRLLVERLGFDYVIRGDGEIPLPLLCEMLLDGGDVSAVPNLVGRDGLETPWSYALTKKDIDENDFLGLDFFPSFKRDTARVHAACAHWPMAVFPALTAFRGCPKDCALCAGGICEQHKHFRRGPVIRDAELVADDLARLDRNPDIRFLTVHTDFLNLAPATYAQTVLRKPTNLAVQFDFMAAPSMDALERMLSAFRGGLIRFCADDMHLTSSEPTDPETLARLIRRVKAAPGFIPILQYNGSFTRDHPEYRRAVRAVVKATECVIRDESHWWTSFPKPDDAGLADPAKFDRFLHPALRESFPLMNSLERAAVFLNERIPASWAVAYRMAYYRLFQNAPFMLRSYRADGGK